MDVIQHATKFAEEDTTKQGAYLLAILRALGWSSMLDQSVKKLNIALARKYIRKHNKHIMKLFGPEFAELAKSDAFMLVDVINPYLIYLWHAQIIGTPDSASLQLLKQTTN